MSFKICEKKIRAKRMDRKKKCMHQKIVTVELAAQIAGQF